MSTAYEMHYQSAMNSVGFIVESMAERPGRVVSLTIDAGGAEALQALFDATMDSGNRAALVALVDAPTLPNWAREQLEVFLYGGQRKKAALLTALH